jgi:hypothetical protein
MQTKLMNEEDEGTRFPWVKLAEPLPSGFVHVAAEVDARPPYTVRRRSPWRSSSGRTSRVSARWEPIVPRYHTSHRAVAAVRRARDGVLAWGRSRRATRLVGEPGGR